MKSYTSSIAEDYSPGLAGLGAHRSAALPGALHLVGPHDFRAMEEALGKGQVPMDFEAKLEKLAQGSLLHRFVEHNCRLFIALLQAANDGSFASATRPDRERLLRVLAYVRKDEDAIPDYKPGGFLDDQKEVRAAAIELSPLLEAFKNWRLQYQVPGMWVGAQGEERP